ncbi:unnamed protein product [Laminaria digitata]
MLMDACGCDLPDEGRKADVSGTGLVSVVQEDLTFFARLETLDAGDNTLPFEAFAVLPQLDELRLPCNSIRDFVLEDSGGYSGLRRLDLSYNSLSGDAVSMLARLPSLTDLDLTCNGLTELPEAVGDFEQLQKLCLERNQLESDAVVDVLSKLPALRELSLAFNYFTGVTLSPEAAECAFPLLEGLDLGFNYIGDQHDVVVLVLLERLQRVILYGNPLAGSTGEDSLGLCVEDLIDKADRVRTGYASYPLEVITEMPRAKHGLAGGGVGRRRRRQRRPYNDTGVTMVDEGHLPSSMAFRASGNESLFRFERGGRGGGGSEGGGGNEPPGAIVEATLRTARERIERRGEGESGVGVGVGVGDLGRVDEVLTSMGVGLDELALEKRARGNNGFVQPGRPGLSSIVRTVNAVLDENEY